MTIYAYSRCSHRDSAESGAGLASQDSENSRLIQEVLDNSPGQDVGKELFGHDLPGHFCDRTTSAFRIPMFQRKAGRQLLSILKRGDYIVCSRVDRMFRSVLDMASTMKKLDEKGVSVRFGNVPVDTGTPMGRVLLSTLATMAEWESHMKSVRTKEALAIRRAKQSTELVDKQASVRATQAAERSPKHAKCAQFDPGILKFMGVESQEKPAEEKNAKKPGKVWIYLRCSHLDSVESGLGIEWQEKVCRARAKAIMDDNPLVTEIEVVKDEAVSAWRYLFRNRPSGKRVFDQAKDGDHLLIARLDRGFRSTRDLAETVPHLIDRGVNVVFASDGMDFSTIWGRLALMMIAQFSELEPQLTSVRIKEALRELRLQGRGIPHALTGFKFVGEGEDKRMVLCRRTVALKRLAYWMQVHCGMSCYKTSDRIEEILAKRENRRMIPRGGVDYDYACNFFGLPRLVIEAIRDYERPKQRNGKKSPMRWVFHRPMGKSEAWHAKAAWPKLRAYMEHKRREARERTSRRDESLCQSVAD